MIEPTFSVVIPVHNKAQHVAASIASALRQTTTPCEVIVIDDASTDNSAEIIAEINDPLIRFISRNAPGPGGYAARNLGISNAKGDWIAFLDADDIWYETHLADIAAAVRAIPEIGCVATRYDHVFENRRVKSRMSAELAAADGRRIDFLEFLNIWVRNGECPIWTGAAAFRRDVLIRAGLFPAGRALRGGDKDLWLRAVFDAPFIFVPKTSAEFHRDSENKVSKMTRTDTLPILVETARDLMSKTGDAETAMLRRLINQQIGLYARFSFKTDTISRSFARSLYLPEGVGLFLFIEGMRLMPRALRQWIYGVVKRAVPT
jgi:succinoglycan biosynthesis protein ExoO